LQLAQGEGTSVGLFEIDQELREGTRPGIAMEIADTAHTLEVRQLEDV
jgi:hypothetical protein